MKNRDNTLYHRAQEYKKQQSLVSAPALVFDHVPHQLELTGRHRDIVLVTALCSVSGRNFAVRLMITIVHCACAPWERTRAICTLDFVHWELFPLVGNPLPAFPPRLKGRFATLPEEAPTHNEVAQGLRRVHVLCRLYDARVKELSQTRMQLTNVGVWPKRHACALTSEAVLGLAPGAVPAAAAGACAGAPFMTMPSPTILHGAWSWMSCSSCSLSALAPVLALARTPNSSSASIIFGLPKDLSITASTVGTDAAMPPRPQQGLPAVAARRVQC